MSIRLSTFVFLALLSISTLAQPPKLDIAQASRLAKLPLTSLEREYPNKISHVLKGQADVASPSSLHPAFYGSYDWHSSVHGHWMLVSLLKRFPQLPQSQEIRQVLDRTLTAENLLIEAAYFQQAGRKSFERPYGWAWLLKLAQELHDWDDPQARQWLRNLEPLTKVIEARYLDFFPRQSYPIRSGTHSNSAFGLTLALDYARALGRFELESLITECAKSYYYSDRAYPASWEPGGDHFLSPALTEADLMRRVLEPQVFEKWLQAFLPELHLGRPKNLFQPVEVSDRSDPKIVHLDGLNLSRAWGLFGVAQSLPLDSALRQQLVDAADSHLADALEHVSSGNYEGEHWLASFAVLALKEGETLSQQRPPGWMR